jgi:uncharacterized membrane protein
MRSQPRPEDLSSKMKPQSRRAKRTVPVIFALTSLVFSFWLGGVFLAPYLRGTSSPWTGLVYAVYAPFCHQIPDRSLSCFGYPLSVCTRCLGINLGFLLGLVLYPFIRGWRQVRVPEKRVFFLLSAPIVLDTAGNFIKLWQSPNAVRLATGLLWGVLLPFYFITGVVDFLSQRRKKSAKTYLSCGDDPGGRQNYRLKSGPRSP